MELDLFTIGIFLLSFALCAAIVLGVSMMGAKEQSFEEALEEQRRRQQEKTKRANANRSNKNNNQNHQNHQEDGAAGNKKKNKNKQHSNANNQQQVKVRYQTRLIGLSLHLIPTNNAHLRTSDVVSFHSVQSPGLTPLGLRP